MLDRNWNIDGKFVFESSDMKQNFVMTNFLFFEEKLSARVKLYLNYFNPSVRL